MSDAKTQQKKKQLMVIGVIVVTGVLFFLRLVFWRQEFKTTIAGTKNQPNDTLKNFSNQWQEIRGSIKTQMENYKNTTTQMPAQKLNDQQLEILKQKLTPNP